MIINNLEVYGIIYKVTNSVNGKVYIGQTTNSNGFKGRYDYKGEGVERIYNKYQARGGNEHLFNSIKKYGFNSFKVEEIFDIAFSQTELNIKEKTYIRLYNSDNNKFGYNKTDGGDNGQPSLETRKKMSIPVICLNDKEVFYSSVEAGEYYNIESYKIGQNCRGRQDYVRSGDKRLIFLYLEKYESLTEEEIKSIKTKVEKKSKGGKHHNARKVYCITFNKIFDSVKEANGYYGIKSSCISMMLQGKINRVMINGVNTIWCYYEDYLKMTQEDIEELKYKSTDEYRSKILSEAHSKDMKKVICLTTNEVFNSIKEAIKKYNCSNLYDCLKGRLKTTGKHPITNEKLEWDYYKE